MILTIFWTCYRHLEIDSRALRGPIGRVFSFLWLYNQPFYMPPNLPRALRKGAVFFKLGGSRLTYWDLDVSSFFLSSFFLSHNLLLLPHASSDFYQLGQKQVWVDGYKTYGSKNSSGVIWGHRGQKDDFTKNASPPTDYMVWSCD